MRTIYQCRARRLVNEEYESEGVADGDEEHHDHGSDEEASNVTVEGLGDGGEHEPDIGAGPAQEKRVSAGVTEVA